MALDEGIRAPLGTFSSLVKHSIFSSPGRSPGRAIGLSLASALAAASALAKTLTLKFFYMMGKALSGKLSCLCDKSCVKLLLCIKVIDFNILASHL